MNKAMLPLTIGASGPLDQSVPAVDDQTVLSFLRNGLDRSLATPVGAQLRSLIEYGVSGGSLPPNTRLPAIRTMAQAASLSPETVSAAYKALQTAGILVSYPGSGTFVAGATAAGQADAAALREVEHAVDKAIMLAGRAGIGVQDLVTMIRLRQAMPSPDGAQRPLTIAMVGIFEEATQAYAIDIASYLPPDDTVIAITIDQLAKAGVTAPADLYMTLPSRERQVRTMIGGRAPVASVSVIPSEATRGFFAALHPDARLGLVARFEGFVGLMTEGARAFAPHVRAMVAMTFDAPDLAQRLQDLDVVVYSTGADAVVAMLDRTVRTAEFRHTPDPHAIRTVLLPLVESLRAKLPEDTATD